MTSAVTDRRSATQPQPVPEPVETPSGKGAADENFPVGSFLISAELRPHVACYYAFARAIDDIADDSELAPEDKAARLDGFDRALAGEPGFGEAYAKAHALRESLTARGVPLACGRDLIVAFKQDAYQARYEGWEDLARYCRYSANPVGRFLIDLHGEDEAAYGPSDALCTALQVLNHLQDCGDDLEALDRVYLPTAWMAEEGTGVDDLRADKLTPGLRRVVDRLLDRCDGLIGEARALPSRARDRRFAMECGTIVALAGRLSRRLRRGDPLAERVALSKLDFALCAVQGIAWGLFGRRPAKRSPS
ncbi:MAG: squalene synthase HpnC [Pseudomonadota bacterium]